MRDSVSFCLSRNRIERQAMITVMAAAIITLSMIFLASGEELEERRFFEEYFLL